MNTTIARSTEAAHAVVTNPENFHTQPEVLACAWDILMAGRGKRVVRERLGSPAHIVKVNPLNLVLADFDSRAERIRERIRRHVAQSSGGDAA